MKEAFMQSTIIFIALRSTKTFNLTYGFVHCENNWHHNNSWCLNHPPSGVILPSGWHPNYPSSDDILRSSNEYFHFFSSHGCFSWSTHLTYQIYNKVGHIAIDCYHHMNYVYQDCHPLEKLTAMAITPSLTHNNIWCCRLDCYGL